MNATISLPVCDVVVVDGDTLRVTVSMTEYVRLAGIDAPEMRIPAQRAAAEVVAAAIKKWLSEANRVRIDPNAYDKFGQRVRATVEANGERQLCDWLLNQELVHKYEGGRRPDWTDEELSKIEARRAEFVA